MIDAPAMRYLLTLSLFLSDKLTSERSAANKQIGKILQKFSQLAGLSRLVFFTYPCLSLLKPMSKSPRWQCRLSCGFARDNLSQRFGRDIGALWRLQQEIHVIGQEEVYFWFYLVLHVS